MKAHFFDLDILIRVDSGVWLVDKSNPKSPIINITQSEFNLIKKGIYKKFNCPLDIGGKTYWLPENLYNSLKIKCKKLKVDFSRLAFSMQEFLNPEVIDTLDYDILTSNFGHLKNSNDDIYVICSKNSKRVYETIIKKLDERLFDLGLKVKNYYFISETFYNRNEDNISNKKVRLLLQHLIGLKTESDKFTDEEITKYSEIFYYDDEPKAVNLAINANRLFEFLISNTEKELKSKIKDQIKSEEHILIVNQITNNLMEPFISHQVAIEFNNVIKTFESFKWKF